jgi:hypothetical protein
MSMSRSCDITVTAHAEGGGAAVDAKALWRVTAAMVEDPRGHRKSGSG